MTKYFINSEGGYVGAFDGAAPPIRSVEVPIPPEDARQRWDLAARAWGPVPPHVPSVISDRQFFHVLATDGLITQAEALTAVKTGDPPAAFETFIASLPEGERFSARMLLEGATTFERNHPLTNAFGTMYGMTADQIDDLWRRASLL